MHYQKVLHRAGDIAVESEGEKEEIVMVIRIKMNFLRRIRKDG